jgi:hypothetical protein
MAKKSTKKQTLAPPKPAFTDERICFGIAFFDNELDAMRYHDHVRERGLTYNGGWFDGMSCGREKQWDHVKDGVQYYAVTH